MDGMKVVQVAFECVEMRGGAPRAVFDFQRALGGEVVSFTSPEMISGWGSGTTIHIPTDRNVLGGMYGFSSAGVKQAAGMKLSRADLVVIHGLYRYHATWAFSLLRSAGIPYWVVPHGILDPYVFTYRGWQKKIWMRVFGRPILNRAKSLIFTTRRELEKAPSYVDRSRARVVHLGVDYVGTEKRQEKRAALREQLGIPIDARVVLFVGRLHPMKRVLETILAFHECGDPRLLLLIVGPDSKELTRSECERYIAQIGARRIQLSGPMFGPQLRDFYLVADVFISLSHRENFGYSVADALAYRLPVILSPGNDLADELRPVRCGWFLESIRTDETVATMREVGEALPGDVELMGQRGQGWARRELGREMFSGRISALARESVSSCQSE